MEQEPVFLTPEQIDSIHRDQIEAWGGLHGLRSEGGLESAIAQPMNVYFYGDGDLFEIAAAYAYYLAESQAYLDGNKRTAVQAALDFLEINGVDTSPLPELVTAKLWGPPSPPKKFSPAASLPANQKEKEKRAKKTNSPHTGGRYRCYGAPVRT